MSTPNFTRRQWLAAGAALGLAACGGGADRTKARIRFVNASGYDSLDMSIDDAWAFSGVAYGQGNGYYEANPDKMASTIRRSGAATSLLSFTPAVGKDLDYTLLAWGKSGALAQLLLDENAAEPDSGKMLLRVFNAAGDAGALDVYVTAGSDALADAEPLYAAPLAAGTLGAQVSITSGSWRLRVTAGGDSADLRLDLDSIVLASRTSATLVLTPGSGGVLVNALLLTDRGGITLAANPQARVRVASGMQLGTLLGVSAGDTALVSNGGGLTVGNYKLVTAGDSTLRVTVDGLTATGSSARFTAGGDHTLLVWGSADAPQYTVIADDNTVPSSSSRAKLRLVHGVAGFDGTLSLTADSEAVADGVSPGQASAYTEVAGGSGITLTSSTPGNTSPVTASTDKTLIAGDVYTCFVVGAQGSAQAILKLDRQ